MQRCWHAVCAKAGTDIVAKHNKAATAMNLDILASPAFWRRIGEMIAAQRAGVLRQPA
jgi:hypothetical protein